MIRGMQPPSRVVLRVRLLRLFVFMIRRKRFRLCWWVLANLASPRVLMSNVLPGCTPTGRGDAEAMAITRKMHAHTEGGHRNRGKGLSADQASAASPAVASPATDSGDRPRFPETSMSRIRDSSRIFEQEEKQGIFEVLIPRSP